MSGIVELQIEWNGRRAMDPAMKSECLSNTLAFLGLASGIRYSILMFSMLVFLFYVEDMDLEACA